MDVLERLNCGNNNNRKAEVHNLNGTSDNRPPKGYHSWRRWWEDKSGRNFGSCSCYECESGDPAEFGAHVQKLKGDSFKICVTLRAGIILIIHPSRWYAMPKYKLSLEERQAEKAILRPLLDPYPPPRNLPSV